MEPSKNKATKKCKKCLKIKEHKDFRFQSTSKDKLGSYCILCANEYAAQKYEENKAARRLKMLEYNRNNREKLNTYHKKWVAERIKG